MTLHASRSVPALALSTACMLAVVSLGGCASGGAAADPAAAALLADNSPVNGTQATLVVKGMSCPLCANNIDTQLRRLSGVTDVHIDMSTGFVTVDLLAGPPSSRPTRSALAKAVANTGFTLVEIRTQ
jgi:copper chaperone CopZ